MASSNAGFSDYQKFVPPPYEEPPRQHGCFFYGCIIASVLTLLLLIAVGIGGFFLYRFLQDMRDKYTATAPRELPKVEMPAEERRTLKERVEAFKTAIKEGKPAEPLVLTAEEINSLIDENADFKGKFYVTIVDDKLKGKVSVPLDDFPSFGLTRGRYLNGEAELSLWLKDGVLFMTITSFEINGERPSEAFLNALRGQNWIKDIANEPKNAKEIRKLESVDIKDGKLIIKAKRSAMATNASEVKPSSREESKDVNDIVHSPETKPATPTDRAPAAKDLPDDVLAPAESRPITPAQPVKKP